MFEKVNKFHPDKVMDRIAGAMVDWAYHNYVNPRIAVEGFIGHGECHIIAETSCLFRDKDIHDIVDRIAGPGYNVYYKEVPQDPFLSSNQDHGLHCGDNGIFKGVPTTSEQYALARLARKFDDEIGTDGKYIVSGGRYTICQSHMTTLPEWLEAECGHDIIVNPLGPWTGGPSVDTGAVNRKLGSDMGDAVTGGGLHGKDLSKADVSVNVYAFLKASYGQHPVLLSCSIGDAYVDGKPYSEIVDIARRYINGLGGFEKLAEYGLI